MKDLDKIGEELFSKLRGRFKRMTIGNEQGPVTNVSANHNVFMNLSTMETPKS